MVLEGHVTNENNYISTTRLPLPTKRTRMVTYRDGSHKVTWLFDHVILLDHWKKPWYLYYQSIYGNQTWQDGNLTWRDPTHNIKWPFDYVVLLYHVTNWKHLYYDSTCDHQTWQGGKMPWRARNHDVTCSLNQALLWGHVTY